MHVTSKANIIGMIVILIISSFLIYFLTHIIISEKDNVIDHVVFLRVGQMINPMGLKAARLFSFAGTGSFLVPAYIIIIYYLTKHNERYFASLTAVTAVSSLLLGWLLKWVFHRSRPLEHLVSGAGGYSFPSGHALGGFIFSGMVICLVWQMIHSQRIKWPLSILVFIFGFGIGFSRIYLHVHFATDVLGSFFIAIWWLTFMHLVFGLNYNHNASKNAMREPEILITLEQTV